MKILTITGLCLVIVVIASMALNQLVPGITGWMLLASLLACSLVLCGLFVMLVLFDPQAANRSAGQPVYRTADGPLIEQQTRRLQAGSFPWAPAAAMPKPADNWADYVARHRQCVTQRAQAAALKDFTTCCVTPNPYRKGSASLSIWAIEYAAEYVHLQDAAYDAAHAQTQVQASAQQSA